MPYTAYYLDPQGNLQQQLDEGRVQAAFSSNAGLLWIDISGTTEEDGQFLNRVFGFHPLSIEDCVSAAIHAPKIEDFGEYLFFILRGINYNVESEVVETTELDLFVGPHFVVSNHNEFLYSIDGIARLVAADGRPLRQGADFLAYALSDALINNIAPTIDSLGDRMDIVEVEALSNPNEATLQAIIDLKKSILGLRRSLSPQKDVLEQLSRRVFPQIGDEARVYFRETSEHMLRLDSYNELLRERSDTALATYMSAMANKQNEVMKVLSITATIFLPLGLLAGIYGMNFENMPELAWPWGYYAILGIMATVICGVSWMFWARRWVTTRASRLGRFVPVNAARTRLSTYVSPVTRFPRRL